MSNWKDAIKKPEGYPLEDWPAITYLDFADRHIAKLEATIAELETALNRRDMTVEQWVNSWAKDKNALEELREAARDAVDAVRFYKPEHKRAAIDALAALLEGE